MEIFKRYWTFFLLPFCFACQNQAPKGETEKPLDTPTSGQITAYVEMGYEPLLSTTIDVFDSLYPDAVVQATYSTETSVVKALQNKEALVGVISRPLTENELIPFKNRQFVPEQTIVAYDALALIVNNDNPDATFTMEQMTAIMQGTISSWSDINPKNKLGKIQIVFDNQGSGTVRYAIDSIAGGKSLPENASAVENNQEVIEYVKKNKAAIGIISNNWISDTDDKGSQTFLNSIQLVGIARAAGEEAFTPYQAYLKTGDYPYKRPVYVINAQPRAFGLGRGFSSFIAGPTGQRIILKEGLVPANAPIRLMQIEKR